MLEVKHTDWCGHHSPRSGRNILEAKKFT